MPVNTIEVYDILMDILLIFVINAFVFFGLPQLQALADLCRIRMCTQGHVTILCLYYPDLLVCQLLALNQSGFSF